MQGFEQYRTEIVGLTSMHSLGSGTQLLEKDWTDFYSGVARCGRWWMVWAMCSLLFQLMSQTSV